MARGVRPSSLSFLEHREQCAADHSVERLLVPHLLTGGGEYRIVCAGPTRGRVRDNESVQRGNRVGEPASRLRQLHRRPPRSVPARIGQDGGCAIRTAGQRLRDRLGPPGENGDFVRFESARGSRSRCLGRPMRAGRRGVDLVNCDVKASGSVVDGPAAVGAATGCAVHADGEQHSLCPGFEWDLADASGWIFPKALRRARRHADADGNAAPSHKR
jgi:hypothetical protein